VKKTLAIIAFCILYSIPSFAILDLGVVGGVSQMTEPTTAASTTSFNVTANTGRSYGLMAQFHSSFGLGLSVGLLYTEVNFHELETNGVLTISNSDTLVPYYQIPVILNYWVGGILAFGAGGYYGLPGGNISTAGTSGSFAAQNYKSDDFGLVGDFQIRVPLGIVTYLTATALYEYGLENVSTQSGLTAHNQGFVFLAGLGIGF
jgi:hypothetical protein